MLALGSLEGRIMDVLWDKPDDRLYVNDVLQRLDSPRPMAYTTVKTVLDNLCRKELAIRGRGLRACCYQPAETREAVAAQAVCELARTVNDLDAFCAGILRRASPQGIAALRRAIEGLPGGL